jgi:predicted outer membrane protein
MGFRHNIMEDRMTKRTKWILLGAGAVLAGAVPLPAQVARYRSDYRISTSKEPVVMPMPEPSVITHISVKGSDTTIRFRERMPVRAFRIEDYLGLNEPQLTAFMASRDTAQIGVTQLAQQKVTDPEIRWFAGDIEAARTELLADTWEVIGEGDHVGAAVLGSGDYERARRREVYAELENMKSGPNFDASFLRSQFFLTSNELAVLEHNRENAHDDELESLIKHKIKRLNQEIETSRRLMAARNISLP